MFKRKNDLTQYQTPHTYAIIFIVAIALWVLTFLIPAGSFDTHDVEYAKGDGSIATRTVLLPDTFRFDYDLEMDSVAKDLEVFATDTDKLTELEIDPAALEAFLQTDPATWTVDSLGEIGLTKAVIWNNLGSDVFDTTTKLHKTAEVWGTDDYNGFGVLNYIFEGLVTGDRYGSAVGIVALILIVGGAFGIIMKTGAVDAGIYAMIRRTRGMEKLALPILFVLFALGGATFGMSEEVIPFAMILVPMVIAMGYDSITAVTVSFVASQVGNATSWMNPFGVTIAQGIAGVPVLSGAGFRIIMFICIVGAATAYTMVYANKVKKNPEHSVMFESDKYFRDRMDVVADEQKPFTLGHKLILVNMLICLIWIVWGVMVKAYYLPEIASQFFVMGFVAGVLAIIFKCENMTINDMASSFQQGVAGLAGTAVVVGMAKGLIIILGGSDPTMPTALNTILHGMGNGLEGMPEMVSGWFMYVFQSLFNVFISSNSGQAALTMPIMAPLADVVGVTRQVATLAYQLGSGFVDAITPVSASLIGVLAVARVDWVKWFKFQIKMQGFLFLLGTIAIIIAVAIGFN